MEIKPQNSIKINIFYSDYHKSAMLKEALSFEAAFQTRRVKGRSLSLST